MRRRQFMEHTKWNLMLWTFRRKSPRQSLQVQIFPGNKHFLQSLAGGAAADAECNDNISCPPTVRKPPTTRSPSIINTGSECKVAIIIATRWLVAVGRLFIFVGELDDNAPNKLRQMVKFAGHNSAIVIGWKRDVIKHCAMGTVLRRVIWTGPR
jgi:hypothetical protein